MKISTIYPNNRTRIFYFLYGYFITYFTYDFRIYLNIV